MFRPPRLFSLPLEVLFLLTISGDPCCSTLLGKSPVSGAVVVVSLISLRVVSGAVVVVSLVGLPMLSGAVVVLSLIGLTALPGAVVVVSLIGLHTTSGVAVVASLIGLPTERRLEALNEYSFDSGGAAFAATVILEAPNEYSFESGGATIAATVGVAIFCDPQRDLASVLMAPEVPQPSTLAPGSYSAFKSTAAMLAEAIFSEAEQ
jgi:hypothetical protein